MQDDVGDPISYLVLAPGTPVYAEGGRAVGKVKRVLAVEEKDIFDGIVIHTHHGERFVDADRVGAIHERAVALRLSEEACAQLPEPEANPGVMRDDPAAGSETTLDELGHLTRRAWNRLSGKY
ncbi:MAG: hypothetical protein ACR2HD_06135 [Solirubrobacteraceae bacterium]|nr:MAG: hypothetical protein DLM63_08285 [Solirubrobacterales bacterium]